MVYAMLQQQGIVAMIPDGWCLTPAFISEQASSKPRRIRHQEVHAQSHCQHEGEVHYTLHSSLRYNTAEACFGQDAGHCRHRGAANSAVNMADKTFQNMEELVAAERQLCCNTATIGTSIWYHQFQFVVILSQLQL